MTNCVVDDNSTVMAKIVTFENAIAKSSKFSIKGINEEKEVIVIEDTTKDEGIYGRYIEIGLTEIVKPIDQLMDVLNMKRKPEVLEGITRIVGYYSRVSNWNKSKIGELRDRVLSRYEGGYGFNGTEVDMKAYNEALAVVNNK